MSGAPAESGGAVVLTGGAGFIGSHLADALTAAGRRLVVIDDLSSGDPSNLPEGVELHVLDVRSEEAARLVEGSGADVLLHQAAQMNVRRSMEDPMHDADINILGGLRLLEAARKGGLRQVVFSSTGGAIYGEQCAFPADEEHPTRPLAAYGVAKLAFERYLYAYHASYGLDAACLRYANVYGERQNPLGEAGVVAIFLDHLLAGRRATIHGEGDQTRDYVHVSDVVRANLAALGRPGFHVYNVGTGVETSVLELYRELAAILGSDLEPIFGPAKKGDLARSVVDPAKGRRELELPEPVPLADGLERTADWFRDRAASA